MINRSLKNIGVLVVLTGLALTIGLLTNKFYMESYLREYSQTKTVIAPLDGKEGTSRVDWEIAHREALGKDYENRSRSKNAHSYETLNDNRKIRKFYSPARI